MVSGTVRLILWEHGGRAAALVFPAFAHTSLKWSVVSAHARVFSVALTVALYWHVADSAPGFSCMGVIRGQGRVTLELNSSSQTLLQSATSGCPTAHWRTWLHSLSLQRAPIPA